VSNELQILAEPLSIEAYGPGVKPTSGNKNLFEDSRLLLRFMWAEGWENPDDKLGFSSFDKE
jgi:hypothetical protein